MLGAGGFHWQTSGLQQHLHSKREEWKAGVETTGPLQEVVLSARGPTHLPTLQVPTSQDKTPKQNQNEKEWGVNI